MPERPHVPRRSLIFLKLGGSLLTDKRTAFSTREETIVRLAREVHRALERRPDLRLVLGHGSGSFGHWEAAQHCTREGVTTAVQWAGFAAVASAAARLNRLVADRFLAQGVPVLSIPPSASARCRDGELQCLECGPICAALAHGLVPLVYGDVAFDETRGGTIVSTEDVFAYLAEQLSPGHVLLAGEVEGVLDRSGRLVSAITPAELPLLEGALAGSSGVDVTGGMARKVAQMVALVERQPSLCVRIFSGMQPGATERLLVNPAADVGTRIALA